MNIREYISSGILESYVMGELTAQERAEVERNMDLYPEIKAEIRQIEETQEAMLMQAAVRPRLSVRSAIMEKVAESRGRTVSIRGAQSLTFWRFAAAASIVVAILASALAYNYRQRWKETESSLIALSRQNTQI
ncbi:MAG TPA: hypothetical protein VEB86_14345, partial [Chryseosolibacter sp.]|nr:hypothetical protein [Chryseosolibacter sp.]